MINKNLGHATAYAYYKAGGGTMTEAEFTEFMADFGTAAQTAVEAAQAALASETSASASATTASTKASEATTAATTATTKAGEAQTSAQTASTKASEASQSASTASTKASQASQSASQALTYKTAAESAKTASQTAQGLAETAQTGAETAQEAAEDARDLAQQYAESIDPGHIYSAFPTDTAEGSIASFADGADDIPLKSLVVDINPVQSGSGDPSPDNVRPISGWTGANVVACGKNLFNSNGTVGVWIDSGGVESSNISGYLTDKIQISPSTQYTFKSFSPDLLYSYIAVWYDASDNFISRDHNVVSTNPRIYTSPANANSVRLGVSVPTNTAITKEIVDGSKMQFEEGSTATPYEPYNGQTIPIDWQTEAGTVYGGKLDVLTGVLTVDRAMDTFNLSGRIYSTADGFDSWTINLTHECSTGGGDNDRANKMCDCAVYEYTGPTLGTSHFYVTKLVTVICLPEGAHRSDTVTIAYPLATPIEIQLTPHEVRSLLGQNNIFADTGDSAVEYRADTKMYIERLTEPDADMIADANIVSGQYFMVGNSLYLATSNIASGGQVIVGTNCTQKSLATALNEINQ